MLLFSKISYNWTRWGCLIFCRICSYLERLILSLASIISFLCRIFTATFYPDFDQLDINLFESEDTFERSILVSYLSGHWLFSSIFLVLSENLASWSWVVPRIILILFFNQIKLKGFNQFKIFCKINGYPREKLIMAG